MSRFVLTAQLQLQAPSNTRQVVQQIQRQLQGGVNLNVQLQNAPAAQRQLTQINKQVSNLNTQGKNLSKNFGISIRRFASFTIASRAVSLFTNKLAGAVDEAIKFEREIVKIAQVTGKSVQSLDGLTKTITSLSSNLGVASSELVGTTRILAQAGIKANDLEVALSALAKTTLAPTFEDITKTAEGAVAILAQFGQGVGALEDQLGAINKVAGQFAVESGDLISAVRRFGGVFKSAGGELDELLGLFTSVRATTRESAESIATGLRTIFTRIQRPKTIEFLKQFGVQLTDLEGKFVGPFEAVRQLSEAFAGLDEGDIRFVQVAEELGGFRQIGKVIPLIQQFTVAEKARQAALEGRGSLDEDAAKAQQSLAVQIQKVREEFFALIRGISETGTFQVLVKSTLALTSQLIKLADAFKPLIPILASFAAIKIGANIGNIARGIGAGVLGRNQGGPIGFASGGVVPGSGNRDTVPAMLTPGEFVIRKSSVNKIGAGALQAMNSNRFAAGGTVKVKNPDQYAAFVLDANSGSDLATRPSALSATANKAIERASRNLPQIKPLNKDEYSQVTGKNSTFRSHTDPAVKAEFASRYPKISRPSATQLKIFAGTGKQDTDIGTAKSYKMVGPFPVLGIGSPSSVQSDMQREFSDAATTALKVGAEQISPFLENQLNIAGPLNFNNDQFRLEDVLEGARSTIEGYLLEAVVGAVSGAKVGASTASGTGIRADFDLPGPITPEQKAKMLNLFDPDDDLSKISKGDVKRQRSTAASGDGALVNKIAKDLKKGDFSIVAALGGAVPKYAKGGAAPSDTVPALLTPGEFVINKKAAQSIGASNLNRMNKQGVVGFAKGGPVGFNKGGGVGSGAGLGSLIALQSLPAIVSSFEDATDSASQPAFSFGKALTSLTSTISTVGIALAAFGVELNAQSLKNFAGQLKGASGNLLNFRKGFAATSGTSTRATNVAFAKNKKVRKTQLEASRGLSRVGQDELAAEFAADVARSEKSDKTLRANRKSSGGRFARKVDIVRRRGSRAGASVTQKIAGKAAGGLTKLLPSALKLGAGLARLATGPVGLITTGLGIFSSVLKAGFDAQGKYNRAVELGNVAEAERQAVLKETSGLTQLAAAVFGDGVAEFAVGFKAAFGGATLSSVKANAKFAALSAKAQKDLAENSKRSSEALKDVELGLISLDDAFASGAVGQNLKNALAANDAAGAANAANLENRSTGFSAGLRNTLTLGGLLGESAGAKNTRIEKENEERSKKSQAELDKQFAELLPQFNKLGKDFAGAGASLGDFQQRIKELGFNLTAEQAERLAKNFQAAGKAIEEQKKLIEAFNFGLQPATARLTGLGTELGALTSISKGTFNSLQNASNVLESALTGGDIDTDDFNSALGTVTKQLGQFGGKEGIDKLTGTFKSIQAGFANADTALASFKNRLNSEMGLSTANPEKLTEAFIDELVKSVPGPAQAGLRNALADLKIDGDDVTAILAGDFSTVLDKLDEKGQAAFEKLKPTIDALINAQNELTTLTRARIDAERQLVDAQLNAADLTAESAQIIASLQGRKLSGDERASLAGGRLNALGVQDTSAAGLSRLLTSNVGIASANTARLNQTGDAALDTAEADRVRQDQAQINTENQEVLKFARERVKIYQDEIAVAKQRLKLEQDAAQALLAGDVTKFAENINASIAASAFRTGDTASLQALGGEAVAAGFGSLTDEEKRAAKPQLEALGLSSGLADSAAATSPEIQALEAEAIKYAEIIAQSGDAGVKLAEASLKAAENLERIGQVKFQEAADKANEAQEEVAKATKTNAELYEEDLQKRADATFGAYSADEIRKQDQAAGINAGNFNLNAGSYTYNDTGESAVAGNSAIISEGERERARQAEARRQAEMRNYGGYARGGTVYASRGMFIPRGTDTVPAMLTPGEFVVNRAAVQRGNNLQILRSMNGGDTAPNGAPAAMSKGGSVGYYNQGGEVSAGMGDFINGMSQAISQLGGAFGTFSQSVQQLANMKLSVNLSPTRVDVNVIGPMLSELTEATKEVVLNAVVSEIQLNQLGQLERTV